MGSLRTLHTDAHTSEIPIEEILPDEYKYRCDDQVKRNGYYSVLLSPFHKHLVPLLCRYGLSSKHHTSVSLTSLYPPQFTVSIKRKR